MSYSHTKEPIQRARSTSMLLREREVPLMCSLLSNLSSISSSRETSPTKLISTTQCTSIWLSSPTRQLSHLLMPQVPSKILPPLRPKAERRKRMHRNSEVWELMVRKVEPETMTLWLTRTDKICWWMKSSRSIYTESLRKWTKSSTRLSLPSLSFSESVSMRSVGRRRSKVKVWSLKRILPWNKIWKLNNSASTTMQNMLLRSAMSSLQYLWRTREANKKYQSQTRSISPLTSAIGCLRTSSPALSWPWYLDKFRL